MSEIVTKKAMRMESDSMGPIEVPAARNAKFLIGQRDLGPAGVAVWEE